ncbi:MAG TPA: HD domain-containing phosphohydrolase [Kineosporiaceae bacterium]|nr:HD domain-containing phosphohydrolase [Kineosporiaceae bacterium]
MPQEPEAPQLAAVPGQRRSGPRHRDEERGEERGEERLPGRADRPPARTPGSELAETVEMSGLAELTRAATRELAERASIEQAVSAPPPAHLDQPPAHLDQPWSEPAHAGQAPTGHARPDRGRRCGTERAARQEETDSGATGTGLDDPRLMARQLQALVDNSPDLIGRYERDGRRLFANRSLAQRYGRSVPDLVGTRIGEQDFEREAGLRPESARRLLAAIREAFDSRSPTWLEVTYETDSTVAVVQFRLVPELDADGRVVDVLAIGRDITSVKRIEQELDASRRRYRDVFDNALDLMILLEIAEDGRPWVLEVNPAMERAMGRPREEVLGRHLDELYPPEVDRVLAAGLRHCLEAGDAVEVELDLPLPDGRRIYRATTVPARNEDGRIARVVNILHDVTDRRGAEEAQQRLNRALKTLSSANETLVRAGDEASLLSGMCRVMVEVGGYRRAWIGYPDAALPSTRRSGVHAAGRGIAARQDDPGRAVPCTTGTGRDSAHGEPGHQEPEGPWPAREDLAYEDLGLGDAAQQFEDDLAYERTLDEDPLGPVGLPPGDAAEAAMFGVVPVAWADPQDSTPTARQLPWIGPAEPLLAAMRTSTAQLAHPLGDDGPWAPLRDLARRHDIAACLVLPLVHDGLVLGVLVVHAVQVGAFEPDERQLLAELAADLSYGIQHLRTRALQEEHEARLHRAMSATIQALADTTELRDPYTAGHQRRVAQLAEALGRRLGLPEDQVAGLYLASSIHDIGKICVPAEILVRPGKLSPLEYTMVQQHVVAAYELLKGIEFPWPVADIVGQHHERYDGSGYPKGLPGDEQLLESRILAVSDVVEAMSSHRPYRAGLGMEAALGELQSGRGTRYDPVVVDACIELIREGEFSFH